MHYIFLESIYISFQIYNWRLLLFCLHCIPIFFCCNCAYIVPFSTHKCNGIYLLFLHPFFNKVHHIPSTFFQIIK